MGSRPKPEHDTFAQFIDLERGRLQKHASGALAQALGYALPGESQEELERIAQEDQRLAQQGMVKLKVGQEGSCKHIDELTREDRQARIAAESEEVEWLKERVKRFKEGAEAPPIPSTHHAEVRRIPIPRTSVNKLPFNAPHLSGWHHGCCCPTAQ